MYKQCLNNFRKIFFLVVLPLIIIEITFQVLAFLGFMPALSMYSRVPYARVYWAQEGFSHGLMNRYGWYDFDKPIDKSKHNVALIGDSFVEALQVNRKDHFTKTLVELNSEENNKEFFTFGRSGVGPAVYFEVLKYAHQYYSIKEAIVFIFLGNDFSDVSSEIQQDKSSFNRGIYYDFDENHQLKVIKESQEYQRWFKQRLLDNHENAISLFPRIIKSHFLTWAVVGQIYRTAIIHLDGTYAFYKEQMEDELKHPLWFNEYIFEKDESNEAKKAKIILTKLIGNMQDFSKNKEIDLKVVVLPAFMKDFYEETSDRDYLKLEKYLSQFCKINDLSVLALGKYMGEQGLTRKDIQKLYLVDGLGHFSKEGHQFLAKTLYLKFFKD